MGRVTGIGGIFFKAENPQKLYEWYEEHLGIRQDVPGEGASFRWKDDGDPNGLTIWSIFKKDTEYFEPSIQPFMMNFRVEDLDGLVEALKAEGVWVDPKREDYEYGRFAWMVDPEEIGSSCGSRQGNPKSQEWVMELESCNKKGMMADGKS